MGRWRRLGGSKGHDRSIVSLTHTSASPTGLKEGKGQGGQGGLVIRAGVDVTDPATLTPELFQGATQASVFFSWTSLFHGNNLTFGRARGSNDPLARQRMWNYAQFRARSPPFLQAQVVTALGAIFGVMADGTR